MKKKSPITKTLVIMAAGMGSRYGGFKQTDALGPHGEFLIDYTLYDAWLAGFDQAVIVVRPGAEADFKRHFQNKSFTLGDQKKKLAPLKISYAPQKLDDLPAGFNVPAGRTKPWGTGHALRSVRNLVSGPLVVLTADDYYGRHTLEELARALTEMNGKSNAYAMIAHQLGETLSSSGSVSRGLCKVDQKQCLTSLHEHTHIEKQQGQIWSIDKTGQKHLLAPDRLVSMAIFAFTPEFFDYLETEFKQFLEAKIAQENIEFFTPNVVNQLLADQKITMKVYSTPEKWFGLTNPADKKIAVEKIKAMISAGIYPEKI